MEDFTNEVMRPMKGIQGFQVGNEDSEWNSIRIATALYKMNEEDEKWGYGGPYKGMKYPRVYPYGMPKWERYEWEENYDDVKKKCDKIEEMLKNRQSQGGTLTFGKRQFVWWGWRNPQGSTLTDLMKYVKRILSWTCVTHAVYCFEWKALDQGLHVHMCLWGKANKIMESLKRAKLKKSDKQCSSWLMTDILKDKLNYMTGRTDCPQKNLIKNTVDKQMREKYKLADLYAYGGLNHKWFCDIERHLLTSSIINV